MNNVVKLLRGSGLDAVDARVLLRAVLGVDDVYLIAHDNDTVSAQHEAQFRALAARRLVGEPVAYLVGEREFYGHVFKVTPAVLIPRPETELLVDLALQHKPARVLDLDARVTAIDRSQDALAVARENAQRLTARNVEVLLSNWFDAVAGEVFDVIVANPPYVAEGDAHLAQGDLRFEPLSALVAGAGGLDDIRRIVAGARVHLAPGGGLLFEHGYDQAARCREFLLQAGFGEAQSWRDLAGIERVSGGCVPPL